MKHFTSIKPFNFFFLFISIFLTLFVVHVYFHQGFPYTHDGENHLARFANYTLALREHQFPPRFAPNLFSHYGYPVFNFNYPLANILSVPFTYAHFDYEATFKIIVFFAVVGGVWGTRLWCAKFGFSKKSQCIGMILFAINPYLFTLILYRGNIGEILALCLFPWIFWCLEKKNVYLSILLFSLFLLSHNTTVVFSLPIFFFYAVFRVGKNFSEWKKVLLFVVPSLLLTLWFWLPAVFEKSEIVLDQAAVNTQFSDHFPTLSQLLFSPLRFGFSYSGPVDSLSFTLGIAQILLFIGANVVLIKKWREKKSFQEKKTVLFFTCVSILCVILAAFQLSFTEPLWRLIAPIAKYMQFPWRLTLFWEVLFLPLGVFAFEYVKGRWRFIIILLLAWQAYAFWALKPADYFHRDKRDYEYFSQSTSTNNENLPRSFTYQPSDSWQPTPVVISGNAHISVLSWRGSSRKYEVTAITPVTIIEPTMRFLGWETNSIENGKKTSLSYTDSSEIGGRIAYTLTAGTYIIETQFTQNTTARKVGNAVSAITSFAVLVLFILSKKKDLRLRDR